MDFPNKEQAAAARNHFRGSPYIWYHVQPIGDTESYDLRIERGFLKGGRPGRHRFRIRRQPR